MAKKGKGKDVGGKEAKDFLKSIGVSGAECLSPAEADSLGNLTLNELKGLAKAQSLLPPRKAGI